MRAIVYSRVSTDAQERDGTSLDTQERACLDYARARNWQPSEAIRDAASGFTLERPGIEHLRQAVRRGEVDVVLAYAVDRLSRNQNHIGVLFDEFEQHAVKLEFVTEKFEDTAIGRFILAARAFIAEIEREKIVERTTRGKAERARSGRLPQATGKGIYGYQYHQESGTRTLHPLQAPIVRRIFAEFVTGSGVSRIAHGLNADGMLALGGGPWHPLTIRRMVLNETYCGRTVYRRTRVELTRDPATGKKRRRVVERDSSEWIEVPDASPAIVDGDTFQRAQALLNAPERRQRGRPTDVYRLRGRLRCLACGTPMTGQALGRGRWRYYRCRNSYARVVSARCNERYVPRDLLERSVMDEIITVLTDPDRLRDEVARAVAPQQTAVAKGTELSKTLARVKEQQKRLALLFVDGDVGEEFLNREAARLRSERSRLERELAEEATPSIMAPRSRELSNLRAAAAQVAQWIRQAAGEDMDLLLRALDIRVKASRELAVIEASLPLPESVHNLDLVTIERTSA